MRFNSLEDLYLHELEDLHSAESLLIETIPDLASKASSPKVKRALESHLTQTKKHLQRLETIFKDIGHSPSGKECKGMKGLLKEGQEILKASGDEATIDAALIAAGNKVEHYEIAGYGTARAYAQILGHERHAQILQETLDEEAAADEKLTQVAESLVNPQAVHS